MTLIGHSFTDIAIHYSNRIKVSKHDRQLS